MKYQLKCLLFFSLSLLSLSNGFITESTRLGCKSAVSMQVTLDTVQDKAYLKLNGEKIVANQLICVAASRIGIPYSMLFYGICY